MGKGYLIIVLLMIVFLSGVVSANTDILAFKIDSLEIKSNGVYESEQTTFKYQIVLTDDYSRWCDYSCEVYNSINPTDKKDFILNEDNPSRKGEFSIGLIPNQNTINGRFMVRCERAGLLCSGGSVGYRDFSTNTYGYNGDGNCQNEKENCKTSNDCSCSKEGKSSTGKDLKQCVRTGLTATCETYCNNGVCDSNEDCSTCEVDCKKCDGKPCISASECSGGFCIHEKCSNKNYIKGDGFCDNKQGENCKNSLIDCGCGGNERCGQSGICETYCGNGICEQEEAGKCELDCDWCGDGTCDGNENCKTCELDCGKCKEEKSLLGSLLGDNDDKKEIETEEIIEETESSTSKITGRAVSDNSFNKNESITTIIITTITLLILLVSVYAGRKIWINRGDEKSKRVRELKKNLKKHEKTIKKLGG